jgi:DNA-binding NarL/FixJ family response regulator
LRASGETLRRREPDEAEELTPQELQIALQVAEGRSNKEVGAALFLSHKTIEFHLSRIYRKLDIHSRRTDPAPRQRNRRRDGEIASTQPPATRAGSRAAQAGGLLTGRHWA